MPPPVPLQCTTSAGVNSPQLLTYLSKSVSQGDNVCQSANPDHFNHDEETKSNDHSENDIEFIQPQHHPDLFVPIGPDSGWAWVVLVASIVSSVTIDGICMSIGLVLSELVDQLGASKVQVSLLAAFLLGCYQIAGEY